MMPRLKSLLNDSEIIEVEENKVKVNLMLGYWELLEDDDKDVVKQRHNKKQYQVDEE